MGRIARVVAVGFPHHVTQRGNNRADVFFTAADRKCYILTLARCCQEFKLKVWAYCLMSNHVHIVGTNGDNPPYCEADRTRDDKMVERTLELHKDLPKARTAPDKIAIGRQLTATDKQID